MQLNNSYFKKYKDYIDFKSDLFVFQIPVVSMLFCLMCLKWDMNKRRKEKH